jgi:hypothetical protein
MTGLILLSKMYKRASISYGSPFCLMTWTTWLRYPRTGSLSYLKIVLTSSEDEFLTLSKGSLN